MSKTAIDLTTGDVIDLEALLKVETEGAIHARFSGQRFGCVQCLQALDLCRTGLTRSVTEILAGVDLETLPREKHFRTGSSYSKNGEHVVSPSCFCHLPGLGASSKCDSPESRHHAFCYELARGKRSEFFPGGDPRNLVATTMARYVKDPAHREPDVSFLVAESAERARRLQAEIDRGEHRTLDFEGYAGLLAVEVQLSRLTVPEYKARSQDHRRHFRSVAWVFHEHFLANVRAVREHLHQVGEVAWVIREDGGGRFHLEELQYKSRSTEKTAAPRPDYCKSALLILAEMQTSSLEAAAALAEQWEKQLLDGVPVQFGFPVSAGFPSAI